MVGALGLVGVDLWTKSWAEERLSSERLGPRPAVCASDGDGLIRYQRVRRPGIEIITDYFELDYAENCGAAFGLLRGAPTAVRTSVFGVAAVVATIVLLSLFVQGRGGPWFAWSVPLVIAGALGNLFDRVRYGYVVDFIHVHLRDATVDLPVVGTIPLDWPTFNVADIAISIGVVLLLIDGFGKENNPAAAQGEPKKGSDQPAEAA